MGRKAKVVFAIFCFACLANFIVTSEAFEHCIKNRKGHQAYHALYEDSSLFVKMRIRGELDVTCTRTAVTNSENATFVAALSGIFVAGFTFALWHSTEKLWLAGREALETTERAYVFLDGFVTEITTPLNIRNHSPEDLPERYKSHPHLYINRFAAMPS